MAHILIAYASRNGSTAEIAQAIGKELQAAGHAADVVEMGAVPSLSGYNAVVIGGPLYMGKMVGDVGKFVKRHRNETFEAADCRVHRRPYAGLEGPGRDGKCGKGTP